MAVIVFLHMFSILFFSLPMQSKSGESSLLRAAIYDSE
jgi:hypothetical protein